ncbi:Uncharacterised protein [Enterococcus hirae]|uniref:Uncharacterized protein n=1 Tax=Enterococcus hirae TaxID=1354 RepID=A0A7Z9AX17_ENTHR|nr:Uncharacterised protein [Enterococcus hirae]
MMKFDDIEDKVEDNSKKNAYLTGKKLGDKIFDPA